MATDVIMPALGMAQETGKVLRWLKAEGDEVAKGEPLMEVETDKVTVEIEAPADGLLAGVRAPEGAEVPVGADGGGDRRARRGRARRTGAAPPRSPRRRSVAAVAGRGRSQARRPSAPRAAGWRRRRPAGWPPSAASTSTPSSPAAAPTARSSPRTSSPRRTGARPGAACRRRGAGALADLEHHGRADDAELDDARRTSTSSARSTRAGSASWRDVARQRLGRNVSVTDLLVRATAAALRDAPARERRLGRRDAFASTTRSTSGSPSPSRTASSSP